MKNMKKIIKLLSTIKGSGKDVFQVSGIKLSSKAQKISIEKMVISCNRDNYEEVLKVFAILGIPNPIDVKIEGSWSAILELEKFSFDFKNEEFSIENFSIKSEFENIDVNYNADVNAKELENAVSAFDSAFNPRFQELDAPESADVDKVNESPVKEEEGLDL